MRKKIVLLIILLAVYLLGPLFFHQNSIGENATPDLNPPCPQKLNASLQVLTIHYVNSSGDTKSLDLAIWYPTLADEAIYSYRERNISGKSNSSVALNSQIASCSSFPIVMFSHGDGGCGTQSVFFTEELARKGYIVVAPDHDDALCSVYNDTGSDGLSQFDPSVFADPENFTNESFRSRMEDIRAARNFVEAQSTNSSSLLFNGFNGHEGISGHSLGTYTGLGISGGWPDWYDSSYQATLLFSAYVLPYAINSNLSLIHVPVMYQGARFDLLTVNMSEQGYPATNPPKYMPILPAASHYVWTNSACDGYYNVRDCLNNNYQVQLINNYAFAFLDCYLKLNVTQCAYLQTTDPQLFSYAYDFNGSACDDYCSGTSLVQQDNSFYGQCNNFGAISCGAIFCSATFANTLGQCQHSCVGDSDRYNGTDAVCATCQINYATDCSCAGGFYDLDGLSNNGCEYSCAQTNNGSEICDDLDNDCDGSVDETGCESGSGGGGSVGGGGGGGGGGSSCTPQWSCPDWGGCINDMETRVCVDTKCDSSRTETQACRDLLGGENGDDSGNGGTINLNIENGSWLNNSSNKKLIYIYKGFILAGLPLLIIFFLVVVLKLLKKTHH